MKIVVNTFSSVKTLCGFSEKEFNLNGKSSVGDVLNALFKEYNTLIKLKNKLLFAVNEEYCDESKILQDGDQLSIFPPVSGG
ncbi:MAG: MoaD/ThiS family protein [Spirochaetes bacterium]|nr:MoaD/ThiS family protein [Spirochaetota bacterium]